MSGAREDRYNSTGPQLPDAMNPGKPTGITYRDAGVDIDAGDELVDRIKPLVRRTQRPEVLGGIGGFGALVEIPPGRWQHPVLVSGTDGVGTNAARNRCSSSTTTRPASCRSTSPRA